MKTVYMYIHLEYLLKDEDMPTSQGIILVSFGQFLLSTDMIDFAEEKLFNFYKSYSTQPWIIAYIKKTSPPFKG